MRGTGGLLKEYSLSTTPYSVCVTWTLAVTQLYPALSHNNYVQKLCSLNVYSSGKGKVNLALQESVGGAHLPLAGLEPLGGEPLNVRDTWPVRRQTYGYLPSCQVSSPIGWYQIILLGDRGTRVLTTCPGLHSTAERLGFEPATCCSQVQHPTATPPSHTYLGRCV